MKNRSTGRLGRLFNVVIPECFYRGSQPLKNTTRFPITTFGNDARRRYVGGFTLIELLVVVLIIGILSAIAIPQYQKAVARSRAVEAITTLRALTTAQEEYYMANGGYTKNLEELSVQVKNTKYYEFVCKSVKDGDNLDTCYAHGNQFTPTFEAYSPFTGDRPETGKMWCVANSAQQHDICRTFGPLDMGTAEGKGYYVVN